MRFGNFRHEHNRSVFGIVLKLGGVCTRHAQDVSAEFDGGDLQAEADPKVGDVFGSCVVSGLDLPLNAAVAKSAGNQDAVRFTKRLPCRVVLLGAPAFFEVAGFNPVDDKFSVHGHGGVLQALDDGKVSVGEVGVLPNHGDVNLFGQGIEVVGHGLPFLQHAGGRTVHAENIAQALLLKHQRNMVDVGDIVRRHDSLGFDVAKRCKFVPSFFVQRC